MPCLLMRITFYSGTTSMFEEQIRQSLIIFILFNLLNIIKHYSRLVYTNEYRTQCLSSYPSARHDTTM